MDVVLDRKTLGYSCVVGWKRVMVRRNINLVPGGGGGGGGGGGWGLN